jgi:hypothetical protein
MKQDPQSAWRGLWAVAWRSIVFLPMMVGVFLLLLVHIIGLFYLPFIGGVWICYGLWQHGLVAFAVWLLLLFSWRPFRLHKHFQSPPSVL